jgi:hypothetical protein
MTTHELEVNILSSLKKRQRKVPDCEGISVIESKDFKAIAYEIISMLKKNRMILEVKK